MKIFFVLSLIFSTQVWAGWTVATYNIRNFDRDHGAGGTNLEQLGRNIREYKSDVMTFIEVVNVQAFETLIKRNLPGYKVAISSCGGFGKQKLAVAFNPNVFRYITHAEDLSFTGSNGSCGSLRPGLLVNLVHTSTNRSYIFGAFHLKAGGSEDAMRRRWAQYQLLANLARVYAGKNFIITGDLNTTGYNIKDADYDKFQTFLSVSRLLTTSQNLGCTSYWSGTLGNGLHQSSILDHIVVENRIGREVTNVSVGAHCAKLDCRDAYPHDLGIDYQNVSDHCPIQVSFK